MSDDADTTGDTGERERLLTVAQVRPHPDHAAVMFFETARIYRLPRTNPAYERALRLLREALARGMPVRVRFVEVHGEVIEAVGADTKE
jgi:hypothetical protein